MVAPETSISFYVEYESLLADSKSVGEVIVQNNVETHKGKDMVAHVISFIDKGLIPKLALLLEVDFVDSIEKTSVGKIDKKVLKDIFSKLPAFVHSKEIVSKW